MTKAPVSNREWIYWGETDPLFGVLTRPNRHRGGANPWSLDEVRADGAEYFASVIRHWRQYGCGADHCVEIGCGSGRITAQLASHFARVTALDVSPAQVAMATTMLGERASAVDFHVVTAAAIPLPDASCDGVFSCEVFQHFASFETSEAYFREAARVLRPGGTLCVQIPVRGVHGGGFLGSAARRLLLRAARPLGRRRMMEYRLYPAPAVLAALDAARLVRTEMRLFRPHPAEGFHGYYFATRP